MKVVKRMSYPQYWLRIFISDIPIYDRFCAI